MTLTSTTVRVQYAGTGARVSFPVTFSFWALDDLEVVLRDSAGAETSWIRGTQYTLTGGSGSTGTLTVVTTPIDYTPASGETLTIKSNLADTQPTEIPLGGALPSAPLEQQLDQIVRQGQQRDETLDRSLRYPLSDVSTLSATLPASANRASKLLGFDASGEPIGVVNEDNTVTVTAAGTTTARLLVDRFADVYSVLDFGAVFDGATDDSAGIQAALDAAFADGGGFVTMPRGTAIVGTTLVIKSGVYLMGQGLLATILKAATGLDAAVLQSFNFASLTGQNKFAAADGVQRNIGAFHFTIDGNKANNTLGNGVEFYAKNFRISNLYIHSCAGNGWYSEAGLSGTVTVGDTAENHISVLVTAFNDGHGIQNRGPHDAFFESFWSYSNAGWGARFEQTATYKAGAVYVGKAHIFSNTAGGFFTDTLGVRFDTLVSESNFGVGVQADQWSLVCSTMELYNNCRTTGSFQLVISSTSQRNFIGNLIITAPGQAGTGGAQIAGSRTTINGLDIRGDDGVSTGTGLQIDGTADFVSVVNGQISLFNGVGGIGLDHNNGSACVGTQLVNMEIIDCETLWENNSGSQFTILQMVLDAKAGQTLFSGTGPNVSEHERWTITGTDSAGARKMSFSKGLSSNIDLNSTAEQSITYTHNLMLTPDVQDIQATLVSDTTNTTKVVQYIEIDTSAITATTITFKVKLSTAAGAAITGNLAVSCHI